MAGPDRFDVAVVGGGSAGIAAAVSAARAGARTLLVERSELLGGNAALALVHTICGLYHAADGDAPPRHAHPGFPRLFAEALARAGAAGLPERAGRVHVLPTRPPALAAFAEGLCRRTPDLALRTRCELVDARPPDAASEPFALGLRGADGAETRVHARVVLDTSGDAVAGALSGAEAAAPAPHELQLPSYIFRMEGVGEGAVRGFARMRLTHAVAGAVRSGDLPAGCESVLVRPAGAPGEVYVTLNVPRPEDEPFAPLDPEQVARLERRARRSAESVAEFLARTREEFAGARVAAWPRRIGIRETRRLAGRAELSGDDVLSGRRRDDEVALSTWPVELWHDHRRARFEHPEGPCSVPLDALVSRSHERLGMAGRCLSASHEALGALRVIGTALATGEAAGVAAALAAAAGTGMGDVAPEAVRRHIAREASRSDP